MNLKHSQRQSQLQACPVCGETRHISELISMDAIRSPINEILRENYDLESDSSICLLCLNRYRSEHLQRILEDEKGELSSLEGAILRSIHEQESISEKVQEQFNKKLTTGERLSDWLAEFGGSWTFILLFGSCLFGWVIINTVMMWEKPFDPYPFILLNLILSCIAAIQAPIIMMSQNRMEVKDRLRSEFDYRVNLKAELEIRLLHVKLDQLLTHQWERLLDIQQSQMELLETLEQSGVVKPTDSTEIPDGGVSGT